jgi:hypothetical protein
MTLWDTGKLVEEFVIDTNGPFKEEFLKLRDEHLGQPEETPGVFNHPSVVRYFNIEHNDERVVFTVADLTQDLSVFVEDGYIEQEDLDALLAGTVVFSPYRDGEWGPKYPMDVMLAVLIKKGAIPVPERDLTFNVWW